MQYAAPVISRWLPFAHSTPPFPSPPPSPQHAFLFKENTAAHAAIKEVIAMYAHPIWLDGRPVDTAGLDVKENCHLCAMLLTDQVITAADIEATNK